jgi:hypothetical protein
VFCFLLQNGLFPSARLTDMCRTPSTSSREYSANPREAALKLCTPRKALRGGISKSSFQRRFQYLAINAHKMAPRTGRWLQERGRDAPTYGLLWSRRIAAFRALSGDLEVTVRRHTFYTDSLSGVHLGELGEEVA